MTYDLRSRQRIMQVARLIVFLMACVCCGVLRADQLLLITSPANKTNTMSEIEAAQLFLGLGSSDLIPYDQHDSGLRARFYRHISKLSLASVRAHWAKRVFTGRGRPPPIIKSKEISQTLKENPAATTYIYATQHTSEFKVLLKMDTGD